MNIYQKLVEVRKTVEFLKKESDGLHAKYNKGSQVIFALREKLDELGLVLLPMIIEHKLDGINVILTMTMRWVNAEKPEEIVDIPWCAYGKNKNDCAMAFGSALTYAERYFLLKSNLIATDKDDPDIKKPPENGIDIPPPSDSTGKGEFNKDEMIQKIITNVRNITTMEIPENATKTEHGKMLAQVLREVSHYEFEGKNRESGEPEKVVLEISHPDKLKDQKDKRLQAIYGNTKDRLKPKIDKLNKEAHEIKKETLDGALGDGDLPF